MIELSNCDRSDTKSKYTLENSDYVRGFEVSVLIIDYISKHFKPACCKDDSYFWTTKVTGRLKKIRLTGRLVCVDLLSMACRCGVIRSFGNTSDPTKCVSIQLLLIQTFSS